MKREGHVRQCGALTSVYKYDLLLANALSFGEALGKLDAHYCNLLLQRQ